MLLPPHAIALAMDRGMARPATLDLDAVVDACEYLLALEDFDHAAEAQALLERVLIKRKGLEDRRP